MSKYCPENERVKRDYTFYLEAANGKQNATIDAALRDRALRSVDELQAIPKVSYRAGAVLSRPTRRGDERQEQAAQRRDRHIDFSGCGPRVARLSRPYFSRWVPSRAEFVADYVVMLKVELGFSDDDPLFPSTQIGRGEDRGFVADGLSRIPWSGAGPIRRIFRTALAAADLLYTNPHSFRDTLVRLGQRICRTPEEWKVWSQNLGHENEATTFVGYGHVPTHRHAEIMQAFGTIRPDPLPAGLDIAALKAFVQSVEAISAS